MIAALEVQHYKIEKELRGEERTLTTVTRWPMLPVMAALTSSSVGGSMIMATFSDFDNKGSVPFCVTHGCSCSRQYTLGMSGHPMYPNLLHRYPLFWIFLEKSLKQMHEMS